MVIARIIPPLSKLPQCEAERISVYYCDTPTSDRRCLRRARFLYNGRVYCSLHAKAMALNDALSASIEEVA